MKIQKYSKQKIVNKIKKIVNKIKKIVNKNKPNKENYILYYI